MEEYLSQQENIRTNYKNSKILSNVCIVMRNSFSKVLNGRKMSKLYEHSVHICAQAKQIHYSSLFLISSGIVVGVFIACWLPFFIMYVLQAYCDYVCVNPSLERYITWIGKENFSFRKQNGLFYIQVMRIPFAIQSSTHFLISKLFSMLESRQSINHRTIITISALFST